MDKLEDLYTVASNENCFKENYECGLYNFLGELNVEEDNCVDLLLLEVTLIQKLTQRLETDHCYYLRIIVEGLIVEKSLLYRLLKCLDHKKQHVVFSAAKALTMIIRVLPRSVTNVEWIRRLFDFRSSGKEMDNHWRSLYAMEVLRKVLKISRASYKRRDIDNSQQHETKPASYCQHNTNVANDPFARNKLVQLLFYFLNLQHVLFQYVPFIVRPNGVYSFVELCQHVGTADSFVVFQASLKLGNAIHHQENGNVKREKIGGLKENTVIAFLCFLMETIKYFQGSGIFDPDTINKLPAGDSLSNTSPQDYGEVSFGSERVLQCTEVSEDEVEKTGLQLESQSSTISQLCTVLPTLIQYFHYARLPSLIFKKILKVLNQVLIIPRLSLFSKNSECARIEKIQRISAISFLCVFECCFLNRIPKCSGFVAFCGRERKTFSDHAMHQLEAYTDVVALRAGSLAIVKSCVVVLRSISNKEGSSFFKQLILSCITSWCDHILSLAGEIYTSNITMQNSSQSQFCSLLIALFSDQDDQLVEALLFLLLLYQEICRAFPFSESLTNIREKLIPHLLFMEFMQSIDFDHSILLDLLISSETRFLEYIVIYLHFVVDDWKSFSLSVEAFKQKPRINESKEANGNNSRPSIGKLRNYPGSCEKSGQFYWEEFNPKESLFHDQGETQVTEQKDVWNQKEINVSEALSSAIFESGCCNESPCNDCYLESAIAQRQMGSGELSCLPERNNLGTENKGKELTCLESISFFYPSSDESDGGIEDNATDCYISTDTVSLSDSLEKIMSVLIRLRMSVVRLSGGGHFPYPVSPLISLMETVERCYDGC